jgi:hypothetical protein
MNNHSEQKKDNCHEQTMMSANRDQYRLYIVAHTQLNRQYVIDHF